MANQTFLTVVAFALGTTFASAGTFTRLDDIEKADAYVFKGVIEKGDARKFERLFDTEKHVIVVINSPGGNAMEGLELGRIAIRHQKDVTLVADRAYSAAGMWWLGDDDGTFLRDESEVGWHLPYMRNKRMPEGVAQLIGYEFGKYLTEAVGTKAADAFMNDLAEIQDRYGKNALRTYRKDKQMRIRK